MKRITTITVALLCVVAWSVLPGCKPEEPLPDPTKKLYSQHDEEVVIRDFFDDRKGGFFVDVGSAHPRESSTTYFLEKHLGWSGIAIDAQAGYAAAYKTDRPKTKFFGYAVSDKSGETIKLHLLWGMSSVDPNWHKNFSQGKDLELKAVDVPTITLNDLLEQNHVEKIDFLSMDIEGAEPAALAGFDIEKYAPKLVCIEAAAATRAAISSYFEEHGYERIAEPREVVNWYFTPKQPRG